MGVYEKRQFIGCQNNFMAFAGPPLKLSERVARPTPLATAPIEQMLTSLNLGVQKSLDPDANNLVAAGTFVYGSLQSPVKVMCLKSVLYLY